MKYFFDGSVLSIRIEMLSWETVSGWLATACTRWMPILNRTLKAQPRRSALRCCIQQ